MRKLKYLALLTIAVGASLLVAPKAQAQVSLNFGINTGPQPVCPYGYYDYGSYNCAPYGYYGPEWFSNGIFIGAGPWFRGRRDFHGYVDNRYDPRYGYRGDFPHRGDRDDRKWHDDHRDHNHFHGNEWRDGRGHGNHGDHGGDRGDHGDHEHGNQENHGNHGDHGDHGHGH